MTGRCPTCGQEPTSKRRPSPPRACTGCYDLGDVPVGFRRNRALSDVMAAARAYRRSTGEGRETLAAAVRAARRVRPAPVRFSELAMLVGVDETHLRALAGEERSP